VEEKKRIKMAEGVNEKVSKASLVSRIRMDEELDGF
jgi:hypothetical protein